MFERGFRIVGAREESIHLHSCVTSSSFYKLKNYLFTLHSNSKNNSRALQFRNATPATIWMRCSCHFLSIIFFQSTRSIAVLNPKLKMQKKKKIF
jgi:hypothetical protein